MYKLYCCSFIYSSDLLVRQIFNVSGLLWNQFYQDVCVGLKAVVSNLRVRTQPMVHLINLRGRKSKETFILNLALLMAR